MGDSIRTACGLTSMISVVWLMMSIFSISVATDLSHQEKRETKCTYQQVYVLIQNRPYFYNICRADVDNTPPTTTAATTTATTTTAATTTPATTTEATTIATTTSTSTKQTTAEPARKIFQPTIHFWLYTFHMNSKKFNQLMCHVDEDDTTTNRILLRSKRDLDTNVKKHLEAQHLNKHKSILGESLLRFPKDSKY